jgi:hypothetical protein
LPFIAGEPAPTDYFHCVVLRGGFIGGFNVFHALAVPKVRAPAFFAKLQPAKHVMFSDHLARAIPPFGIRHE